MTAEVYSVNTLLSVHRSIAAECNQSYCAII